MKIPNNCICPECAVCEIRRGPYLKLIELLTRRLSEVQTEDTWGLDIWGITRDKRTMGNTCELRVELPAKAFTKLKRLAGRKSLEGYSVQVLKKQQAAKRKAAK